MIESVDQPDAFAAQPFAGIIRVRGGGDLGESHALHIARRGKFFEGGSCGEVRKTRLLPAALRVLRERLHAGGGEACKLLFRLLGERLAYRLGLLGFRFGVGAEQLCLPDEQIEFDVREPVPRRAAEQRGVKGDIFEHGDGSLPGQSAASGRGREPARVPAFEHERVVARRRGVRIQLMRLDHGGQHAALFGPLRLGGFRDGGDRLFVRFAREHLSEREHGDSVRARKAGGNPVRGSERVLRVARDVRIVRKSLFR